MKRLVLILILFLGLSNIPSVWADHYSDKTTKGSVNLVKDTSNGEWEKLHQQEACRMEELKALNKIGLLGGYDPDLGRRISGEYPAGYLFRDGIVAKRLLFSYFREAPDKVKQDASRLYQTYLRNGERADISDIISRLMALGDPSNYPPCKGRRGLLAAAKVIEKATMQWPGSLLNEDDFALKEDGTAKRYVIHIMEIARAIARSPEALSTLDSFYKTLTRKVRGKVQQDASYAYMRLSQRGEPPDIATQAGRILALINRNNYAEDPSQYRTGFQIAITAIEKATGTQLELHTEHNGDIWISRVVW